MNHAISKMVRCSLWRHLGMQCCYLLGGVLSPEELLSPDHIAVPPSSFVASPVEVCRLLQPSLWLAKQRPREVESVCECTGWGTEPQLGLGP